MPAKPSDQKSGLWGWLTRHWKMIRRVLMFIFVAAVIVLLVTLAREVEWDEVLAAMKQTKPMVLAMAIGLTCASYLIYSTYDLLGRIYAKHDLSNWRVMLICAISYAFNLSLGSFVGGMGFRYRLYSRHGLSAAKTTRILGLSLATNWMGYFLLGGVLFASGKVTMPKGWEVGTGALQLTWFNQPWIRRQLEGYEGEILAYGQIKEGSYNLEMASPEWEKIDPEEARSLHFAHLKNLDVFVGKYGP
ncbi:MAG: hypothetical protein EON54_15450, partial [Alcaligenaceae bacterium]